MSGPGTFRLAGVMGWPVAHSRSPLLHGHWLRSYGIEGAYVKLPVRPENLEAALRALPLLGFAGVNLTVPHKEKSLAFLDHIDPAARRLGSVNTIIVRPDGSLEGRSTDGFGFLENLRDRVPTWAPASTPVALIGAGGSASAIAAALIAAGETRIRLVNRSPERAWELAARYAPCIEPWPWSLRHLALATAHFLVNTTTQGMKGEAPLDLDLGLLPRDAIVADIVYVPLETPLLAAARARGNPVVDGLGMLLHQARPGFAAWFGQEPEVDAELRALILQDIAP